MLSFTGTSLHIDSDAAKKQIEELGGDVSEYLLLVNDQIWFHNYNIDIITVQGFGATSGQPQEKFKAVEEEGEEEEEEGEGEGKPLAEKQPDADEKEDEEDEDEEEGGEEGEGGQPDEEAVAVGGEGAAPPPTSSRKKKLVNQFNFCERATLTYINPTRVCIQVIHISGSKTIGLLPQNSFS